MKWAQNFYGRTKKILGGFSSHLPTPLMHSIFRKSDVKYGCKFEFIGLWENVIVVVVVFFISAPSTQ